MTYKTVASLQMVRRTRLTGPAAKYTMCAVPERSVRERAGLHLKIPGWRATP